MRCLLINARSRVDLVSADPIQLGRGRTHVLGVPTIPDSNTSAKASRYKWEPYREKIGGENTTFCQKEGHVFAQASR